MRSIIFGLLVLALNVSNAFASCSSDDATCTSMCVISSALTKQFSGGNECLNNCLNAANACEAREAQQRQMEQQRQQMQQQQQAQQQQQRQQAAERQAQQERDAKEIGGKQQRVQQANEVAQRVGAEAAIQQQFDAAMEKGMQAIDQKGYVSAEYQFKAALKIKPKDVDAKAGLLRAIMGSGRRAAAITYANEQLLALAAQPPSSNDQSAYTQWLEVLGDNGLATDAERSQLERIYPFGGGDPERAVTAFLQSNPKSAFIPFVRQIGGVMPAMIADYVDRRKEAELKVRSAAIAEAKVKADAEAEAKARVDAEAKAKAEVDLELAAWNKIKDSSDPGPHKEFLERFPNGRFAESAKKRMVGTTKLTFYRMRAFIGGAVPFGIKLRTEAAQSDIGDLPNASYISIEMEPGNRSVEMYFRGKKVVAKSIQFDPGKHYYLKIGSGFPTAAWELVMMSEDAAGAELLSLAEVQPAGAIRH